MEMILCNNCKNIKHIAGYFFPCYLINKFLPPQQSVPDCVFFFPSPLCLIFGVLYFSKHHKAKLTTTNVKIKCMLLELEVQRVSHQEKIITWAEQYQTANVHILTTIA